MCLDKFQKNLLDADMKNCTKNGYKDKKSNQINTLLYNKSTIVFKHVYQLRYSSFITNENSLYIT